MNRKSFIQSTIPIAAVAAAFKGNKSWAPPVTHKVPPYLKRGSLIGITCPSGHISLEEVQPAVSKMEEWGFRVKLGNTVGLKDNTFAGTDEERAADFQAMIDDPAIDTIMLGRGGYGAVRMIDRIDFSRFVKHPKWIIGFSDATVFHTHIHHQFGIPTLHSKMCNSFPEDFSKAIPGQLDSIDSIRRCLLGDPMTYYAPTEQENKTGTVEGVLIGGNLSVMNTLCGSASSLESEGTILFLEDVGEYLYHLDGMMWTLKRSGKLDKLKGLIIGDFRIKPDDPGDEFGRSLHDIVMEKVQEYDYPVCFDFPVGHVYVNYALKCGMPHKLEISKNIAILTAL